LNTRGYGYVGIGTYLAVHGLALVRSNPAVFAFPLFSFPTLLSRKHGVSLIGHTEIKKNTHRPLLVVDARFNTLYTKHDVIPTAHMYVKGLGLE